MREQGNEYHDAVVQQCVRKTCLPLTGVINLDLVKDL